MATTYSAVTAGAKDADSPVNVSLIGKLDDNPHAIAEQTAGAPTSPFTRLYYAEEQQASNTNSATVLSAGASSATARRDWVEVVDTLGITASVGGSIGGANNTQITLPIGTYWMEAEAQASVITTAAAYQYIHRLEWYNTSDAASVLTGNTGHIIGQNGVNEGDNHTVTIMGRFAIAASKVFELRHWGFDSAANISSVIGGSDDQGSVGAFTNKYARIRLWQTIAPA